jgi:DNA-binding PadR family transcriptional regulator
MTKKTTMTRDQSQTAAEMLLPLRPIDLQILLVLMESNLHGYGLMKEVERQSGGKVTLEVGSLYRVIKRLLANDLIDEADGTPEESASKRRRNYRITAFGREVARAEADRLVGVIETAQQRQLLEGGKRA